MKLLEQISGALNGMDPTNRAGVITLLCIFAGVLLVASGVHVGKALGSIL